MSDELKHEGTIDTSEPHYQITGIDRATKKVLVNFSHNGHGLHHSVFVDDVDDAQGILAAVQEHYEKYKADVEQAQASQAPILDDVAALIGQKVTQ